MALSALAHGSRVKFSIRDVCSLLARSRVLEDLP